MKMSNDGFFLDIWSFARNGNKVYPCLVKPQGASKASLKITLSTVRSDYQQMELETFLSHLVNGDFEDKGRVHMKPRHSNGSATGFSLRKAKMSRRLKQDLIKRRDTENESILPRELSQHPSPVEKFLVSLLPNPEVREMLLSLFVEAIAEANFQGDEKWATYYERNRVRLLVGNLIACTVHSNRIWMALDHAHLNEHSGVEQLLDLSGSWKWDTEDYPEYTKVASRNGYYTPSHDHSELWPIIRDLQFKFIERTATTCRKFSKRSQAKHSSELTGHLRETFGQYVPEPRYVALTYQPEFSLPEEIRSEGSFPEGMKKTVTVNEYERNKKARIRCIAHYGATCSVCELDFGNTYGSIGEGYIHVHHLKSIADIGTGYEVDPITDLRPVCPNCHAMVHKRIPPYTLDEIGRYLRASVQKT